jgi:hypothetical protein
MTSPSAPPGAHLRGEERKRALAQPGLGWKDWALYSGLKPWIGLGLLIVDVWALVTVIGLASQPTYGLWALLGLEPLAVVTLSLVSAMTIYLNLVVWSYLWANPREGDLRPGAFTPTAWKPFAVGRWTADYPAWAAGTLGNATPEASVEEFL